MLELRRQGIHNLAKARIKGINHRFPGIMGFAFSSNLSMTLSTSVQEFDVLLVGALADPASAGLYYMAKRMAKAAQQLGGQVQAVLYPDVTRSEEHTSELQSLMRISYAVFCWKKKIPQRIHQ